MRNKKILCLTLALCALLLTACQQQETFPNQPLPAAPVTDAPVANQGVFDQGTGTTTINYDDGSYDPASEEGGDQELLVAPGSVITAPPTMYSAYAGATPVLIDPIDKPTPTPLPTLNFSYTTYTAPSLHLSFDAPTGWLVDDSATDTYVLTNPDPSMDYAAFLSIRVVPVAKQYSKNDLINEIKGMLDTIRNEGFRKYEPSKTAGRVFMNSDGIYANYNGTLENGVEVGGRIIAACVNKTLYILRVSFPRGYRSYYESNVYDKFRHSVKQTN